MLTSSALLRLGGLFCGFVGAAAGARAQPYSVWLEVETTAGTQSTSYNSGTLQARSTNHAATSTDAAIVNTVASTAAASGRGPAALGHLNLSAVARGFGGLGGKGVAEGGFSDTLTISSRHLADGTPVVLTVILDLAGTVSATGSKVASSQYQVSARFAAEPTIGTTAILNENVCSNNSTTCGEGWLVEPTTMSATVTTAVGQTVFLQGSLGLQVIGDGNTLEPKDRIVAYGSSAKADFRNTANFYVMSMTEGARYTSASGVSYQPPKQLAAMLAGSGGD